MASTKTITPYTFKAILDEFVYYHTLSSHLRPLVYRTKNAERLISERATDKHGRPLTPRKYPGIPSRVKTVKFISLLNNKDELNHFKQTLDGLTKIEMKDHAKHKIPWVKPSIVNEFIYKSYELGQFGENLVYLNQLNNYQWTPKNVEAIALIRAVQLKTKSHENSEVYNLDWFHKKVDSFKKISTLESSSALLNIVELSAQLYVKQVDTQTLEAAKVSISNLLKRESADQAKSFDHFNHTYSVLSLLKDANTVAKNDQVAASIDSLEPYFKQAESLKNGQESHFEKIISIQ